VNQVWDLPSARARFGRHLQVEVGDGVPAVAELVRQHPAKVDAAEEGELVQGLPVRLRLQRPGASADLDLGPAGRIWPSDEALAHWRRLAREGRAKVVYG
jgi:DNA polymerase-3 subunit alpha